MSSVIASRIDDRVRTITASCEIALLSLAILTANALGQPAHAPSAHRSLQQDTLPPSALGHLPYLDYRNGFRAYKFGDDIAQQAGMQLVKDYGGLKIYSRADEDLHLGEAELSQISYLAFDNKLMSVLVYARGAQNSAALRQVVETAFGIGRQPTKGASIFLGEGKTANYRFQIHPQSGDSELVLSSNEIQKMYQRFRAEAARKAAATL